MRDSNGDCGGEERAWSLHKSFPLANYPDTQAPWSDTPESLEFHKTTATCD
jgi:hypothetical protein